MSEDSTQIYTMSAMLGWCARTFAGTRKTIASFKKPRTASWCRCDGVLFPFDARFMDRKRFVAIACGAIEEDEIAIAAKVIDSNDVIVEFGAGMGIAAARVNRLCTPKQHICFEANPHLGAYSKALFAANELDITYETVGLGNGKTLSFYALDDYILSSFEKPEGRDDYQKISIPTITLDTVIKQHRPTAIFCDIEGAEADYFTSENFDSVQKIVIELHPHIYGRDGADRFIAMLTEAGFRLAITQSETYCFLKDS
ncbi:MAG: FkbM family methyltransferase [Candidatus Puniceispirillaceae bacterium]